jgi:hypothetical protein
VRSFTSSLGQSHSRNIPRTVVVLVNRWIVPSLRKITGATCPQLAKRKVRLESS